MENASFYLTTNVNQFHYAGMRIPMGAGYRIVLGKHKNQYKLALVCFFDPSTYSSFTHRLSKEKQ
ncbi:MAG: hypothetical protein KJN70_04400 [Eudoraea sp.]|nr:hypothetical protein [Eudoraea sp.]